MIDRAASIVPGGRNGRLFGAIPFQPRPFPSVEKSAVQAAAWSPMRDGQHVLRMQKRTPFGNHRATMTVAGYAEVGCHILADEEEIGGVSAVAHRQCAGGVVGGLLRKQRRLRSEGNIGEVQPVTMRKSRDRNGIW